MATWTDKDTFKLLRDTRDSYYHVLYTGVQNNCSRYSTHGEVLPVRTNGEVVTAWWSNDTINAQPIVRSALAEMIRRTKPKEDLPVLVATIPEIQRTDIAVVAYCWAHLNSATTMQLYRLSGSETGTTYNIPAPDTNTVTGFNENSIMRSIGTPCIYYDWREALTPIISYFKTVIKYCKDTGKARRLVAEAANQALNDRTEMIRALVSKNDKRFKGITF